MTHSNTLECVSVYIDSTCQLKNGQEYCLTAACNGENNKTYIFTPNKGKLETLGFAIADGVVVVSDNKIPVQIFNFDCRPRMIEKKTVLGWLEPFDSGDDDVHIREIHDATSDLSDKDFLKQFELENSADKSRIENILLKYKSVFSNSNYDLGCTDIKHEINTGDAHPITLKNRRVPMAYQDKVEAMIQDMLHNGIIRESISPWCFPIVVVKKKNGDIRICVDYRKLNAVTQRPIYPIPDTKELFDTLNGNKFFSTLDLSQGYHQVPIAEKDKCKTSFATRSGQYEYNRMPFGLNGAPATFQRVMSAMLKGLSWKKCIVYLDDLLIFGKTEEQHNSRLISVLQRLSNANLKLSPKKCHFLRHQVTYLGHQISENGISTDQNKIKCIREWPIPKCVDEVHSFLGLCGYYRRFINEFSSLVSPLQKMISMKEFNWSDEQQKSFETLKTKLTEAPVLKFPTKDGYFILDTDASHKCIGAVLSQVQNGHEYVIEYASNKISKTQRKYCVTRKELLAAFTYIKQFSHYLAGKKFMLRTDHRALLWLLNWQKPNTSQYCLWKAELEFYDFEVVHREGKRHVNADAVSRIGQCQQCALKHEDPKFKTNVKVYQQSELGEEDVETDRVLLLAEMEHLYREQQADEGIKQVLSLLQQSNSERNIKSLNEEARRLWIQKDKLRCRGDILYIINGENYLIVIPQKMKQKVLSLYHDDMGHMGSNKTMSLIKERYYWPGISEDIRKYVEKCTHCLSHKNMNGRNGINEVPIITKFPFERICLDIAGPFHRTRKNNRYILGIIDHFSKYVFLIPTKNIDAPTIAEAVWKNCITKFGCPRVIQSDCGSSFMSETFKQLAKLCGSTQLFSPPYHQQSNGLIERVFQTTKQMIAAGAENSGREWDKTLPVVEMALRAAKHSETGYSPYQILFGKRMCLPHDGKNEIGDRDFFADQRSCFQKIRASMAMKNISILQKREQKYKNYYSVRFRVGDKVLIKNVSYSGNLSGHKFLSGYQVTEANGDIYRVKNTNNGNTLTRHGSHMKIDRNMETRPKNDSPRNTRNYPTRERRIPVRYGFQRGRC